VSIQRLEPDVALATPAPRPNLGLRALLRDVNRRIARLATTDLAPLICECENRACDEAFEVPLQLFRVVDSRPELFLVRDGHEQEGVEGVVRREGRYLVVRLPGA
jgi:hypothetical protein